MKRPKAKNIEYRTLNVEGRRGGRMEYPDSVARPVRVIPGRMLDAGQNASFHHVPLWRGLGEDWILDTGCWMLDV